MPIPWIDLTVADAETIRDFYAAVAGLTPEPVAMDGYDDYSMLANGEALAGICHARGPHANIPPVWLPYFEVADLDESLAAALARGGTVLHEHRPPGGTMQYAILRDPAGAAAALIQQSGGA